MDFLRVIEQEEYDLKNIKREYHRGVLAGYEMAIDEMACCLENTLVDLDDGTLRSKLEAEHVSGLLDHLREWMEGSRAELVVTIIEGQPEGE